MEIRLQVYIAKCGICSRRKAEELINSGHVSINDKIVTQMGVKVGKNDIVKVDGKIIKFEELIYLAMNKPSGYVTTLSDPEGRKIITDLLLEEEKEFRLFPVGRLDYDTEGVIILTNDGNLSQKLTASNSNIEKEYLARVDGKVLEYELKKLTKGLKIDDYVTKPCKAYLEQYDKKSDSSLLRIIITEGKNHQVKKMCLAIGHEVKHLSRIRFANITTKNIGKGYYRYLKPHEVKQLYNL